MTINWCVFWLKANCIPDSGRWYHTWMWNKSPPIQFRVPRTTVTACNLFDSHFWWIHAILAFSCKSSHDSDKIVIYLVHFSAHISPFLHIPEISSNLKDLFTSRSIGSDRCVLEPATSLTAISLFILNLHLSIQYPEKIWDRSAR
jgi:hypothetical protein